MAPLTAEDRLLIKALRTEKGWTVDRMITEFPARLWKRRALYYLVGGTNATGKVEMAISQRKIIRFRCNLVYNITFGTR